MSASAAAVTVRLFPRITEGFYRDHPELAAFDHLPSVFDAFRRPDPSGKSVFRRLITAHRQWFTAEIGAMFDKADFYHEELGRTLVTNGDAAECWNAGSGAMGLKGSGSEFRRRFVREVMIDSYAGLFLGQIEAGWKPLERPLVHLAGIARLQKSIWMLTEGEESEVVDPLVIAGSKEGGAKFLVETARLFPRQRAYVSRALGLIDMSAASRLQSAGNDTAMLATIHETVAEAERLRTFAPWCAGCYQLIGLLERQRAILLGNGRQLRAAFEASARADSYGGSSAVADIRAQLDQIHAALQQRVIHIRAQMAANPNSRLTSEGRALVSMAHGAMRDAERWERSPQTREIVALREVAEEAKSRDLMVGGDLLPFVRTHAVKKVHSEPRFADWLGSKPGRRVRWQIVAAVTVALVTVTFSAWQMWAMNSLKIARERVDRAVATGMDTATLDALDNYFNTPRPLNANRTQDLEMTELYRATFEDWAASRVVAGGPISDNDRRRISRYGRLIGNLSRLQSERSAEAMQ